MLPFVVVVTDGRDPPDIPSVPDRDEVCNLGVVEERIPFRVGISKAVESQRRGPEGLVSVQAELDLDEPFAVALSEAGPDDFGAQISPNERPTDSKTSRTRSSCSSVWVAMYEVRTSPCPSGTPGVTTGFV